MNEEVCAAALKHALIEIKNVCPDVNKALVLMENGTIVAGDEQLVDPAVERAVNTLQDLAQKAGSVGGLNDLLMESEKGKVYVSQVNGVYSVMSLSKRADLSFLRTVNGIILPTILKVLNSISPESVLPTPLKSAPILPSTPFRPAPSQTFEEEEAVEENVKEPEAIEKPQEFEIEAPEPLQEQEEKTEEEEEAEVESPKPITNLPSQQLIVDKFGGLMVRSDTVQLDSELLGRWSSLMNVKEIREVNIETFGGKTTRCKVKTISDQKYEGRGLIRIPDKTCEALEIKRGELVRVQPVATED